MIQRDDRDGIRILRLAHGKVSAMDIELGEALLREMQDAATAPIRAVIDRALETAERLAAIPAGALALTKEALYTPILERTKALGDLNARVVDAWMQQHTYDTIRAYLKKTIKR